MLPCGALAASAGRIRDYLSRLASLGDLRHLCDSRRLAFACPFEPPRVGVPRIIQIDLPNVKLFRLIFSQIFQPTLQEPAKSIA